MLGEGYYFVHMLGAHIGFYEEHAFASSHLPTRHAPNHKIAFYLAPFPL
jgi:hypothetical protein